MKCTVGCYLSFTYGGPQLSRQQQKAHGKSKKLTAKTKSSRQKQKAHGKSKKLTAKTTSSRQKQKAHGKNKKITAKTKSSWQKQMHTAKAKSSRQKQNAHGKNKKLTAKIKTTRQVSWTLKVCSQRLSGLNLTWLRLELTCVESKLCQPKPRRFAQTAAPSRRL